jgi:hypothetical protein
MISDQATKSQTTTRPAPPAPAPTVPLNRSWDSCAALRECFVPLNGLEISISFDGLGEPIRYDTEHGLLRYRGTMSHASFLQLQKVCRERHYQRALEQLFVASALPPSPTVSARPWLIGAGGVAATALAIGGLWYSFGGSSDPQTPVTEKIATSAIPGSAAQDTPLIANEAASPPVLTSQVPPHAQER